MFLLSYSILYITVFIQLTFSTFEKCIYPLLNKSVENAEQIMPNYNVLIHSAQNNIYFVYVYYLKKRGKMQT